MLELRKRTKGVLAEERHAVTIAAAGGEAGDGTTAAGKGKGKQKAGSSGGASQAQASNASSDAQAAAALHLDEMRYVLGVKELT